MLLALTKLHSALNFEPNEYVSQIMNDYLLSKSLEVQQRAIDYKFLKERSSQFSNNGMDLIFKIPLTEQQMQNEGFDFDFAFLDPYVQLQISEGKSQYDQ